MLRFQRGNAVSGSLFNPWKVFRPSPCFCIKFGHVQLHYHIELQWYIKRKELLMYIKKSCMQGGRFFFFVCLRFTFFLGRNMKVGIFFAGFSFGGGCVSDRRYDDSDADDVGDEGICVIIL